MGKGKKTRDLGGKGAVTGPRSLRWERGQEFKMITTGVLIWEQQLQCGMVKTRSPAVLGQFLDGDRKQAVKMRWALVGRWALEGGWITLRNSIMGRSKGCRIRKTWVWVPTPHHLLSVGA